MTEWHDGDEVTTTFGSIRQGMLEAAEAERKRIVQLLEEEMCKKCKSKPNAEIHIDCEIVRQCLNRVRKWND